MTTPDTFATLPLPAITASLTNPRKTFHPAKLAELAESIKASGVHQPVLVRPLPGARVADTFDIHAAGGGLKARPVYELIAGERRYRACQMAGLATIPALVRDLSDAQVLEVQIVENLQRDDLTALEEAEGYEALMQHSALSAEAIGGKIGKSRSYVFGRLKLLDLSVECKQAMRDGHIEHRRDTYPPPPLKSCFPNDRMALACCLNLAHLPTFSPISCNGCNIQCNKTFHVAPPWGQFYRASAKTGP